jgi:3-deoxy-D-manno-octulosonate 8-phosphate phosphatase (KDO 8-P phosphatase)
MIKTGDIRLDEKIGSIRVLMLDVDGVLTDGRIIMNDRGEETKHFDVKDGHGLKMLMRCGIAVVLITGRQSAVVTHRARDLGITEVHQSIWDKADLFEKLLVRMNLRPAEVAYIGDDIVDVPLLRRVGFAVAVRDAVPEAKKAAHYVTRKLGGRGAVREACEIIMKAQNRWVDVAKKYEFD